MKENKYFKESEFKCKCGKCELPKNVPSDELVDILCEIREHFNSPITINSGYRCAAHNAKVGGAKTSQHTVGSAVDFVVKGVKTKDVYNYVISKYGDRPLGIAFKFNNQDEYAGFVHLDTRGRKARWEYK
ncbi:YcbK family protein [Campylobacter jejuni]|uniref:YcbK family protein n=1 Tax=Campylobacter jejuni TaxID=197 RepID=UPI000F806AEF|nr:D-Ala-D-Ala carboxypeptidase family metallohydrolase [Campylobacter jejuni]RTH72582.1 peptidase M15 family protein [Campylobacter jejuni]